MRKYRVLLKKEPGRMLTLEGLVPLLTPARIGDKIILPSHTYKTFLCWMSKPILHGMPDWVIKQGTWEIKEVIHQVKGVAVEQADILILIPTDNPLTFE